MSEALEIYQNKYNTKYGSDCKFFGYIKVYKSDTDNNNNNNNIDNKHNFCVSVSLTVYENNQQQFAFSKEFFIDDVKSCTNKNIKMGNYELIGIIDDLENLSMLG